MNEEIRSRVPGDWVRLLLFMATAAIVCAISLRFHFPGYFDPFAVFHIDHYQFIGLQYDTPSIFHSALNYFRQYPRPAGYLFLDLMGRLGVRWEFSLVFFCLIANAALMARYIERLTRRVVPWPFFVLFAALIFVNPEFYIGLKMDPLAVFSLTFLLVAAHAWKSYVETERHPYLILTVVMMFLGVMEKETYFVVAGLFWIAQVIAHPRHRKAAIAMSALTVLFMAWAMRQAVVWANNGGPAYQQNYGLAGVIQGVRALGGVLFVPSLIVVLAVIATIGVWRYRTATWITLISGAFAILSLLPNAVLPNHLLSHYAAVGLIFVCTPILLLDRLAPQKPAWFVTAVAVGIVMYATVRNGQKPEIAGSAGWHRSQEVIARELLGTLDQIKAQTHPGESILVAGMNMPFNPFYAPAFIQRDICACRWTVVQGASGPVTAGPGVRMARASDLEPLEAYNRLFVITPEGKLAGAFDPRRVPISPHQPDSPFGVEFLAGPNPALAQPDRPAKTTLKWSAPRSARIEIRALAPDGPVVAQGGSAGTVDIDPVGDGMVFFLQDASEGNPSAPEKTAAVVIMTVTAPLAANAGPLGH